MLFGVYAEKEKNRVSRAAATVEPKTDTIQHLAVAAENKNITSNTEAFAPIISSLSKITKDFDKYAAMPEYQKVLKRRVDIV